jgi:hypothetical protein
MDFIGMKKDGSGRFPVERGILAKADSSVKNKKSALAGRRVV